MVKELVKFIIFYCMIITLFFIFMYLSFNVLQEIKEFTGKISLWYLTAIFILGSIFLSFGTTIHLINFDGDE